MHTASIWGEGTFCLDREFSKNAPYKQKIIFHLVSCDKMSQFFFIFCLDGGSVVYGSHPLFPPFRIPPTLKFQVGLNLQWTPWNNPFLAHIVFVKRIPVSFHSVLSLSLRWFSVHIILHDLFFLYSPNNLQDTFWGTVKHLEEGHIWDTVKHPEEGNFSDTVMHPDEGYLQCCWL